MLDTRICLILWVPYNVLYTRISIWVPRFLYFQLSSHSFQEARYMRELAQLVGQLFHFLAYDFFLFVFVSMNTKTLNLKAFYL